MRWRSSSGNNNESPTNSGHDNDIPTMSASMDDDEPDSSSSDPVHADGGAKDKPHHGRLGSSGPDLPPSAGGLLENENMTLGEEKKLTDPDNGSASPPPPDAESSKSQSESQSQSLSQAISPATAKADPDTDQDDDDDEEEEDEDEDEDGLEHSHPPDDSSETDTQTTPWKPQTTQSTCEFTHTIVNYSQKRESGCKKAEYSATTVDEFGNRWRLIVYVNGNGRASNHHLSLFLQVSLIFGVIHHGICIWLDCFRWPSRCLLECSCRSYSTSGDLIPLL